jgi:aspartate kinase
VFSLENVHDFPALRRDLQRLFPEVALREGLGAVSVVGAGINARFDVVRECLRLLEHDGLHALGLSTSRFRVSVLLEEPDVEAAVLTLHRELVETQRP